MGLFEPIQIFEMNVKQSSARTQPQTSCVSVYEEPSETTSSLLACLIWLNVLPSKLCDAPQPLLGRIARNTTTHTHLTPPLAAPQISHERTLCFQGPWDIRNERDH